MVYLKVVLTTILSLVVLFIISKLIGYRQMSQMNLFDYINGITIGSIAAELATSIEDDWRLPLIAMLIYGAWVIAFSYLTMHSVWLRKIFVGKPLVIYEDGVIFYDSLRKSKMDINDFLFECRNKGYFELSGVKRILLEPNGKMSIMPTASNRPLTTSDMKLPTSPEIFPIEVIMDGHISTSNLLATGKDIKWLMGELGAFGVTSPSEVLLGLYNSSGKLEVYKKVYSEKEKKKSKSK